MAIIFFDIDGTLAERTHVPESAAAAIARTRAAGNLVCTLPERELHTHTDECYEETRTLACGLEESDGHQHSDACYDDEGNLACGLE